MGFSHKKRLFLPFFDIQIYRDNIFKKPYYADLIFGLDCVNLKYTKQSRLFAYFLTKFNLNRSHLTEVTPKI